MNEERLQQYLNLIDALLTCPSGEEPALVQSHQELIDSDFVQTMLQVAETLAKRGDTNAAQFLQAVAGQLADLAGGAITPEAYLAFLQEVLQATAESDGNPQVVYPILQQNLDKLNTKFALVLEDWATPTLAAVDSQQAYAIASVIYSFNLLLTEFPLGSMASNLEICLACVATAATVFSREQTPEMWAIVQSSLGIRYYNRVRGNRSENLEKAIAAFEAALTVYNRESFPFDWAATQENLAYVYLENEQNSEAISCLRLALEVFTPHDFPTNCFKAGGNLGNIAFSEEQWETAIFGYENAILAVEKNCEAAESEEQKQQIGAEAGELYDKMVQACVNAGQVDQAIALAKQSNSRRLTEILTAAGFYPKEA